MAIFGVILDYLRVLLSPQMVAGVTIVVFVRIFRRDIRALFERIAKISYPGGEVSMSQAERTSAAQAAGDGKQIVPREEQVPDLQNQSPTTDQIEQLRRELQAERARAYLWEYRYLNYFLVPHTKLVLNWFASVKEQPTYSLYDTIWAQAIPNPHERVAVISALEQHYLIQRNGNVLAVTPKGREYIQWHGPLLYGAN